MPRQTGLFHPKLAHKPAYAGRMTVLEVLDDVQPRRMHQSLEEVGLDFENDFVLFFHAVSRIS